MLSKARPHPSMLIATPACVNSSSQPPLVNWLPWSVLQIFGVAVRNASRRACTQNQASKVVESDQDNT
jgi:hypothetical protein